MSVGIGLLVVFGSAQVVSASYWTVMYVDGMYILFGHIHSGGYNAVQWDDDVELDLHFNTYWIIWPILGYPKGEIAFSYNTYKGSVTGLRVHIGAHLPQNRFGTVTVYAWNFHYGRWDTVKSQILGIGGTFVLSNPLYYLYDEGNQYRALLWLYAEGQYSYQGDVPAAAQVYIDLLHPSVQYAS